MGQRERNIGADGKSTSKCYHKGGNALLVMLGADTANCVVNPLPAVLSNQKCPSCSNRDSFAM